MLMSVLAHERLLQCSRQITCSPCSIANSINHRSISARQNLKPNPDGSVDLCIQQDSPGLDKESHWLPTLGGKFYPDDAHVLGE
jgi:hypothetical protein